MQLTCQPEVPTGPAIERKTLVLFAVAIFLGIVVRVVLSAISDGTLDTKIWHGFAESVHDRGLIQTYRLDKTFNHPPLAGLMAAGAEHLSRATGFSFVAIFRLPMIMADAVICVLLVCAFGRRQSRVGWAAAIVFAWNINSILISAHHCNSDSLMAMFMLASACLLERWRERRGGPFTAGAALALAINVKLIPVFLIVPMLAACRTRRERLGFLSGLFVFSLPILIVLCIVPREFAGNVLGYSSFESDWGIGWILRTLPQIPILSAATSVSQSFFVYGKWLILLGSGVLAVLVHRRRLNAYQAAAGAAALFLILTPGFTITYSAIIAPVLLAASFGYGRTYVVIASMMAFCHYARGYDLTFPIRTDDNVRFIAPASLFGLLAWCTLVAFMGQCMNRGRDEDDSIEDHPL